MGSITHVSESRHGAPVAGWLLTESGDVFEWAGGREVGEDGPVRNVEWGTGMDAAIGAGVLGVDVMLAELVLHDAAAGGLLIAGVARPIDEETLSADTAADVAAFMRERTKDLVHGTLLK
jgi:hypothetical protein